MSLVENSAIDITRGYPRKFLRDIVMQGYKTPDMLLQGDNSCLRGVGIYQEDILEKLSALPLEREPVSTYRGKECPERRNFGFFSNAPEKYVYARKPVEPKPLHEHKFLEELLLSVNTYLGTNFTGVVVSFYDNGTKYASPRSENSDALDDDTSAIMFFGAARKFRIREKSTGESLIDHTQKPGELLVMDGDFQDQFKTEIPQQKRIKDAMISVLFVCPW